MYGKQSTECNERIKKKEMCEAKTIVALVRMKPCFSLSFPKHKKTADCFIKFRLYLSFIECCFIRSYTYRMFCAITGSDYRILMSSETNESAAHT